MALIEKGRKMKKANLVIPVYSKGKLVKGKTRQISSKDVAGAMRKSMRMLPDFVRDLKELDNEGWQQVITALAREAQTNKKLRSLVKLKKSKGKTSVSIGEPNWAFLLAAGFVAPAAAAFVVGYAIGTACVKLGPCDFSK